jgi:hypothetical protein
LASVFVIQAKNLFRYTRRLLTLRKARKDNEAKLDAMRATVDEKLQGTLETIDSDHPR